MIITCDASCDMGFYYVKPPTDSRIHYHEQKDNKLTNYVDKSKVKVLKSFRNDVTIKLNKLVLSTKTYKKALEDEEIDAEFFNELDENGNLSGIELCLKKERLIYLVENNAFNCYLFNWKGKEYKLHTMDIEEEVFNSKNIIYPFSEEKDSFAIVKVVKRYSNVGIIMGIITLREDVYPTDYMVKPLFILSE
ncbi:hypothetical protein ACJ2A9_09620 [Anaerobacillus sp. MEB173]|uniref:hypothetical protein n=1 Tax=Anaerobacillus sp. MEB173 TaxID=3383345 RepID=UPI003F91E91C